MMHTLQLLIIRRNYHVSQPGIDLTSELLRGMRLSGVNYRRIETATPGSASALAPWRVKPSSISSAAGRCCCAWPAENSSPSRAAMHCLFPTATGMPMLSDPQATVVNRGPAAQRNGVQHGKLYQRRRPPGLPGARRHFQRLYGF